MAIRVEADYWMESAHGQPFHAILISNSGKGVRVQRVQ